MATLITIMEQNTAQASFNRTAALVSHCDFLQRVN